ncbi:MAG: esterase/lipase family protein [Planctomycetota bacterium]
MTSRPIRRVLPLSLAALACSGCQIFGLKEQVQQIEKYGLATAVVQGANPGHTTFVVAWRERTDEQNQLQLECIGHHPVDAGGVAHFLLENGIPHELAAFTDVDEDGLYDPGEPAAIVTNVWPQPLEREEEPRPTALVLDIDVRLPEGCTMRDAPEEYGQVLAMKAGTLATLEDARFEQDEGTRGMWKPFEFLADNGGGIYFLEDYDKDRVPVLFVHGISGSPRQFERLINDLDRTRFQPWVFHYPSGFRLTKIAAGLRSGMDRLHDRLGFDRMAIVAHSMGGLVSRAAIQRLATGDKDNYVSNLVTISSPFGGHSAATLGVEYLSNPVPAWRDLVPGSEFLSGMLDTPLPATTQHDLLFGFQTKGGMGMPNDNDGVVGVASQLEPRVQMEARSLFGQPLQHVDILSSDATVAHVQTALNAPQ